MIRARSYSQGINGQSMSKEEVLSAYAKHVNLGFGRLAKVMGLPIEISSEGSVVFNEKEERYLDCGGYGVFILGHRHPKVTEAVKSQVDRHPLSTRIMLNSELALASKNIAEVAPGGLEYVFFTNSGTEATELGLKLGRLNGKPKLIAMHGGFHGKSLGSLSVTGRPTYQKPFYPLLEGVEFVEFGALEALKRKLLSYGSQATVIVEPIQAESGVMLPPIGYLSCVSRLCRENGALLILDEIQTGFGRTGTWWACEQYGCNPDILLAGKSLGGGVMPVGAVITSPKIFRQLNDNPFLHTSTFGGNPLAMSAVSAAISAMKAENIVWKAKSLGQLLIGQISGILKGFPELVLEVRGIGLLMGIEFHEEHYAGDFMMLMMKRKVIVCHSLNQHKVVRLTPPATLSEAEIEWLVQAIKETINEMWDSWISGNTVNAKNV